MGTQCPCRGLNQPSPQQERLSTLQEFSLHKTPPPGTGKAIEKSSPRQTWATHEGRLSTHRLSVDNKPHLPGAMIKYEAAIRRAPDFPRKENPPVLSYWRYFFSPVNSRRSSRAFASALMGCKVSTSRAPSVCGSRSNEDSVLAPCLLFLRSLFLP